MLTMGIASCNYGEAKQKHGDDNVGEISIKAEFRKDKKGMIFTGNANKVLANEVVDYLGIEMSKMEVLTHC